MSSPADPFQPDRRAFIGMAAAAGASLAAAGTLGTTEVLGAVPAGASVAFGFTYEELQSVLAIALSRGGDFADLYFERSRAVSLTLEDDRISRAYTSSDLGVGVRVVKGDSVGYAFSELLELPAIKKAASTAAAIADGVAKADVKPLKVAALPNYYSHDFRFASIDIDAKKKLVQDLNSKLKAKDPRVVKTTIIVRASSKKSVRILERRTPTAIMVPISRVRSSTLISMVLATPSSIKIMKTADTIDDTTFCR